MVALTPGRRQPEEFVLSDESDSSGVPSLREPLRGFAARRSTTPEGTDERHFAFGPSARSRKGAEQRQHKGEGRRGSGSRGEQGRPEPRSDPLTRARDLFGAEARGPHGRREQGDGVRARASGRRDVRSEQAEESDSGAEESRPSHEDFAEFMKGFAYMGRELRRLRVDDGDAESLTGSGGSGIRGYQLFAREQKRFARNPERSLEHIYDQKRRQLGDARTLKEFVASETRINSCKLFMILGHITCQTIEAIEEKDANRVKGLLARQLAFIDQCAMTGEVELAFKLTALDDPMGLRNAPKNFPNMPPSKGVHVKSAMRTNATSLVPNETVDAALAVIDNISKTNKRLSEAAE